MFTHFIKFSIVGVFNTGVHYGVFYFLYNSMGMYHLAASGVGYCTGVLNSYVWNKLWTFRRRGSNIREEFSRFLVINFLSLGINLAVMAMLVEVMSVRPTIAQLPAIAFALVVNFLGNRFWTFRVPQPSHRSGDDEKGTQNGLDRA